MSFSLRLTADLTLALVARVFARGRGSSPILQIPADANLDLTSDSVGANSQRGPSQIFPQLALAARHRSPIIWIGGSEPLDSPEVANLSNALTVSGRNVFLETSGASLKPRLHEFRPSSRFYFMIRFDPLSLSNGGQNHAGAAFCTGLEALRMARLAGFFTCANLVFGTDTTVSAIERLHSEIRKLDVDGFLITSAVPTLGREEQVRLARRRFLTRRWMLLSSLFDECAVQANIRTSQKFSGQPVPETGQRNFGEGAEAG